MNYGMHVAASGALSALYRMDVYANNLANATTNAFKPDLPVIRQRDAERIEDRLGFLPSSELLERLGGGVMPIANRTSWEQGTLATSSNPFDLAVEGDGFFMLRDRTDEGTDRIRFTRDGRLTRDARGLLVSVTTGLPVLDVANRPIRIPAEGAIQVEPDGTIRQDGSTLARIQLTTLEKDRLGKLGKGMFQAPSDVVSNRKPASGIIRQGAVEGSAVDAISTMMALTDAARAAESNFSLIQNADRLMDRAINGLGRVSA